MSNVRVLMPPTAMGDSMGAAHSRVQLKLSALAYAGVRCGADASPDLVGQALAFLCGAAIAYVRALGGAIPTPDSLAPTTEAGVRLGNLQLASVAYASARHGADACIEFSRDALAFLCGAAVAYCEALPGMSRSGRRVDDTLSLDRG